MANLTQAQKDTRDRDRNLGRLAEYWGESYAETKRSLMEVSDRDVRILADKALLGQRVI